jgi:hypothetical protein
MNPFARRCVPGAIALFVFGAIIMGLVHQLRAPHTGAMRASDGYRNAEALQAGLRIEPSTRLTREVNDSVSSIVYKFGAEKVRRKGDSHQI